MRYIIDDKHGDPLEVSSNDHSILLAITEGEITASAAFNSADIDDLIHALYETRKRYEAEFEEDGE